jgi:hypothetical protein
VGSAVVSAGGWPEPESCEFDAMSFTWVSADPPAAFTARAGRIVPASRMRRFGRRTLGFGARMRRTTEVPSPIHRCSSCAREQQRIARRGPQHTGRWAIRMTHSTARAHAVPGFLGRARTAVRAPPPAIRSTRGRMAAPKTSSAPAGARRGSDAEEDRPQRLMAARVAIARARMSSCERPRYTDTQTDGPHDDVGMDASRRRSYIRCRCARVPPSGVHRCVG